MKIMEASTVIKELYRNGVSDEVQWSNALENFAKVLSETDNSDELESCILSDENWELSVNERLNLLEKAKLGGASSIPFLKDYYGYLAAHLDPSEEKTSAQKKLQKLIASSLTYEHYSKVHWLGTKLAQ